jgi:hypothetical protein
MTVVTFAAGLGPLYSSRMGFAERKAELERILKNGVLGVIVTVRISDKGEFAVIEVDGKTHCRKLSELGKEFLRSDRVTFRVTGEEFLEPEDKEHPRR